MLAGDSPRASQHFAAGRLLEYVAYAVVPLAGLLAAGLTAHSTNVQDRGLIGIMVGVTSIAASVGALGQPEVLADSFRRGEIALKRSMRVSIVFSTVVALFGVLVLMSYGVPLVTSAVASAPVPILALAGLSRTTSAAMKEFRAPAANGAITASSRVVVLAIASPGGLSLTMAAIAYQWTALAAGIATYWRVIRVRLTHERLSNNARASASYRVLIQRGCQLLPFTVLTAVLLRMDVLVVAAVASPEQTGAYAAITAVSSAALSVSGAFRTRIQAAAVAADRNLLRREVLVLIIAALAVASGMMILAEPVCSILLGQQYAQQAPAFRVLGASAGLLLLLDALQSVQAALGRRAQLVLGSGLGALISVSAIGALASEFGVMGAAIGNTLGLLAPVIYGVVSVRRSIRSHLGVPPRAGEA